MNRLGKGFRIGSGMLLLLNVIIFFLPMTQSIHENYPTKIWSQFRYITNLMGAEEPYLTDYTVERLMWASGLILLPLFLSLIVGIWEMATEKGQMVCVILAFVILALYIGLNVSITSYYVDKSYSRREAGMINLICSAIGSLAAVVAVIITPKKREIIMAEIPQVHEMKQQQIEAKYNILADNPTQGKAGFPESVAYNPGVPRGVMVGLKGMYAGAEIPFSDGECIKLGRMPDNDLVFDDHQIMVSRKHCYIKWNARDKEYLFCDFSSNGTFANGSDDCLPKHLEITVKPGTILAIGDEKNTFRLE